LASDAVLRATLSIQRKLIGDEQRATLETFHALGQVLDQEGKNAEAETVFREALAIWPRMRDDQNPERLHTMRGLAETLEKEGKWPEAETVWRESLPLWRKRYGNEDKESMYTLRKLALALEAEHNWLGAESVHREALGLARKKGDQDPEALSDLGKLIRVLMNQKKFPEAEEVVSKALTPEFIKQPASVTLVVQRVNLAGRRARWQQAAADARLALQLDPNEHYRYHTLAGLLAMNQDRSGYEQICKTLLAKFGSPTNPFVAERIVQDNLLLPDSGVDLELMDRLADTAATLGSGIPEVPYFQACKAMSNYRLGRFAEAIEWGEKAASSSVDFAKAKAYAVMAMAYWQLGQNERAKLMLGKGDALVPSIPSGSEAEDLGESWVAWLMARVSLNEAAASIQPTPAANGKSILP
jgi:tetratricopeptide (TPR) repeat protein